MATTTDELKIRVHVDKGTATKDLGSVISAIRVLNQEAGKKNVKSLANSLDKLASASRHLGKLPRAVAAIEGLKINPKLKENLDKIAEAGARLSSVGRGIKAAADGFGKITKMSSDADLDKKFDSVANSITRFVDNLNKGISNETLERLQKVADTLDRITQNANTKIKGKIIDVDTKESADKAAKSKITWSSVERIFSQIRNITADITRNLYGIFEATGIPQDIERIANAAKKNIPVVGELADAWHTAMVDIKNVVLSNSNIIDKAAGMILVKVKYLVKALTSLARVPFTNVGMTKGIMQLLSLPFKGFIENLKDLTKRWNKFTSSLARIAVYRLIRTALKEIASGIKEGVDNLYLWAQAWKDTYKSAEKFLSSMDLLTTGFLYLKNSIGAAVSPLIDYVAPIIDSLIDKFVALANAINQALAALTGASLWRKAVRYPVTYGDTMSGAKKKADDLKRTVLGFDELNKLDDNKKKSGGGGSDEWDQSKMFEEMAVGDKFRKLLTSYDWTPIGTIIANKINNALANIDWASINAATTKWATRFGTLFNSVLNGVAMPLVGKSFAELGNTIALGINTFFDKIDFETFGKHLANGFQAFIYKADWKAWGKALTQKIKALIDVLYGFKDVNISRLGDGITELIAGMFENIDLARIAEAVAELAPKIGAEVGKVLNGLFSNTNRALGGVDFKALGKSFAQGINNIFAEIDPKETGKFLTNGLNAVLDALSGAVDTLDWPMITEKIGNIVSSMFENIDLNEAVKTAVTLSEKIVDILNSAISSIHWGEVGTALANADTSGLKDGIKALFGNLISGLGDAGVLDEMVGGLAAFIALKLSSAFLKILPSVLTMKAAMGTGAAAGGAGAASGGLAAVGATIAGGIISGFTAAFAGLAIGEWLDHHVLAPLMKFAGDADAKIYESFHYFGSGGLIDELFDFNSFKEAVDVYWGALVLAIEDNTVGLKEGLEIWKGLFKSLKDSIKLTIDGINANITETVNIIKEFMALSWDSISTKASTAWGNIKKGITDVWNGIKKVTKDSINGIIGFINTLLSGAKTAINGVISAATSLSGASIAGKTLSITLSQVSIPQIPYLAGGGMVGQGNLFVAGEAGPELVTSWGNDSAVLNVDQIVDAISQGVAMASGGDITIPVYLDGDLLDTVIVTAQQRQNIRSGGR